MILVIIQKRYLQKTVLFCFLMILLRIQKEVFNNSFFNVLYCFVIILVTIQIKRL